MKRILIIDDKLESIDGTGRLFMENASESVQNIVHFVNKLSDYSEVKNNYEIHFDFDLDDYLWVFFHESYRDNKLDEILVSSFKAQIKNLINFSGGKESIGFHLKATTRELLFKRLNDAILVYEQTGLFPIKYLCNINYGKYYFLTEYLLSLLENGNINAFLKSRELVLLLKIMNYSDDYINKNILPNYATLSLDELYKKMDVFKSKNL